MVAPSNHERLLKIENFNNNNCQFELSTKYENREKTNVYSLSEVLTNCSLVNSRKNIATEAQYIQYGARYL